MAKIVVVYHSGYGHTERVAQTLAAAAQAQLVKINEEGDIAEQDWDTLNQADTIVFGSPTYMGNVSWQFKKFADATSKAWFTGAWSDKLFAGFTNSASLNGDKQVTLQTLQTLASQHGGIWISLGLPQSSNPWRPEQSRRLGRSAGAKPVGCERGRNPFRRFGYSDPIR